MTKLTQPQCYKKQLIVNCISGKTTTREVSMITGLTMRAIQKTIVRFKSKGDSAFIHGNKGKKHLSKDKDILIERIISIFKNTKTETSQRVYEETTYAFFKLCLAEEHNINVSVSFVKKILNGIGYKTPIKHKVKNIPNHPHRERMEHEGELVQGDGSSYDWFCNNKKNCIQGFVDDATGIPVGLYMTKNETMLGYVEAARNMFNWKGIPQAMMPDKAGVFFVNKPSNDGEKHLTQFGLMMEKLGVDMFPAYTPQAKGRIERFWGTIKHRLPILFKIKGIDSVEKANIFLREEFPKIYKRWFPVEPKSKESYYIKADKKEINSILKATFPGKTDKSGVFSLKGYKFFCPELINKKILINLNEKEGLWVTPITNENKRYNVSLIETDTSGDMPAVMKDLIERIFLRNAKPKFREVYIDIDDIILSQIQKGA